MVYSFEIGNDVAFCSDFLLVTPNVANLFSLFTSVVGCTRTVRSLIHSLSEMKIESEDKLASSLVNIVLLFGDAIDD